MWHKKIILNSSCLKIKLIDGWFHEKILGAFFFVHVGVCICTCMYMNMYVYVHIWMGILEEVILRRGNTQLGNKYKNRHGLKYELCSAGKEAKSGGYGKMLADSDFKDR